MTIVQQDKPFRQKKRIAALWITGAFFVIALIICRPLWDERRPVHDALEMIGVLLVLSGILGRLWCILYIGVKKNVELVTSGPYSMTRNPLYFFSTLGIAGLAINYGSVLIAAAIVATSVVIFNYTARKEAVYLGHVFGPAFDAYARRVPLFWPDPRLYRSVDEVTFSTSALAATFRDALVFLMLLPALELIEYLHVGGYLSSMFLVP